MIGLQIDWVKASTVAQAVSAIVVARFTIILVRFTKGYVEEMKRANELQEQASSISRSLVARTLQKDAPFFVAVPMGGSGQRGLAKVISS